MDTAVKPQISTVVRAGHLADMTAYAVNVTYPGENPSRVTFVGMVAESTGPIVMMTPGNPRGIFVTDPSRFGAFGPNWVRRFFTE